MSFRPLHLLALAGFIGALLVIGKCALNYRQSGHENIITKP